MKIALQANVEGAHDIVVKAAVPKRDEKGNMKIARGDHAKLLTIPGTAGNRRLVVSEVNVEALGLGSMPEFWRFLKAHKGPVNGDFRFSKVLEPFTFRLAETMSHDEILVEIEARTGSKPFKQDLTKTQAVRALRNLRFLAEQDEAPPVVEAPKEEKVTV